MSVPGRPKAILLLSGGIDSAVALYESVAAGLDVTPVTFHYPGRPRGEVRATRALLRAVGVDGRREKVDVSGTKTGPVSLLPSTFHLVEIDLNFLHEASASANPALRATPEGYISARNLVFYSIAAHLAEMRGARYIVGGHNGGDPENFPDSSREFFDAVQGVLGRALLTQRSAPVTFRMPLAGHSKPEVVALGRKLGVPFDLTWSCYEDGDEPCGTCPACEERNEALR
ncbi:MAG: 7-cyano-7-deazaguanine synthase [Methanobacteriota archaeon]